MNYEESIEWLNTIPLSFDRNNKNYEFKLDGIKAFLSHLDNPHSKLKIIHVGGTCLLYTSPSPRDRQKSRMPSSA